MPETAFALDHATITAEQIAELFLVHDVVPRQHTYFRRPEDSEDGRCQACAVGIILVEVLGGVGAVRDRLVRSFDAGTILGRVTGWPMDFVDGLDYGFTNYKPGETAEDYREPEDTDAYLHAFWLGWRAAEIVKSHP